MGVRAVRRSPAVIVGVVALVASGCNLGTPLVRHAGPSRVVEIADVDGDGAPDVVAAGTGGDLVLLNDGAGGLAGAPVAGALDVQGLALGDVDGDGHVDRVVVDRPEGTDGAVYLSRGDGAGGFGVATLVPNEFPGDDVVNDAALVDLDVDGYLDLVTAGSHGARVRFNDGTGAFPGPLAGGLPCGSESFGWFATTADDLTVGDVDGDGDPDVAWTGVCHRDTGDTWVLGLHFNEGVRGSFHASLLEPSAAEIRTGLAIADVDEDGLPDRVVAAPGGSKVEVWRGDESFNGPLVVPTASSPGDLAVADIDGDGHVDLVVTSPVRGNATVHYGDGEGAFPESHVLATGASSIDTVATGDLDGDGRVDLVFGTDNDAAGVGPGVVVMGNTLDGRGH